MSKENFIGTLKYGSCDGAKNFLATECQGENAGREEHDCPLDLITPRWSRTCNCCDVCTLACEWATNIKRRTRTDDIRQQIDDLAEYLDDNQNKKL